MPTHCIRASNVNWFALALLCSATGCQSSSEPPATQQPSASVPVELPLLGPGAATTAPAVTANAPTAAGSAPASSTDTETGGVLSSAWARAHLQASAEAAKEAARLEQQAYQLYKQHKDAQAVPLYEQALQNHASASVYYKLGNSLSNVDRLADAVKAYELAIELGYPNPEVAHYNRACAFSRMKQAGQAYAALDQAVEGGYAAMDKLKTDPDLAFLRAQPDWQARLSKIQPAPKQLVGTLRYDDRDFQERFTLCPDGRVIEDITRGLDESCCGSIRYGALSQSGDKYIVQWNQICGHKGVGGRKYDFEGEGSCQPHKRCSEKEVCKPVSGKDDLVGASEVAAITKPKLNNREEPGTVVFVPQKDAPGACNTRATH